MKAPPFLTGAALILWGWQTDFLLVGIVLATLFECSRLVDWRWDLEEADLNRVWDLCSILFIGAAVYLYGAEELTRSGFTLVQWLPMIFSPMMAAQAFGTREQIEVRTFSWLLRDKQGAWLNQRINITMIYFAVCLLAASITSNHSGLFYLAFAVLASWALWHWRPARSSRLVCSITVLAVGFAGYLAHQQLQTLQSVMDAAIGRALSFVPRRSPDSAASHTAMGQIGKLKLSGRVMWRVKAHDRPPELLREAAYRVLRNTVWHSSKQEFVQVPLDQDDFWSLIEGAEAGRHVTIAGKLKPRGELLPLPNATIRLSELPVYEVRRTPLGAVRASGGPPFVQFNAFYSPAISGDSEPGEDDLHIPPAEQQTLDRIVQELELKSKPLDAKLAAITAFFQENFAYASYISREHIDPTGVRSPLALFLEQNRAGHCEYFATATVLLLRAAGEYARYATGYALLEKPPQSEFYLVRERHAHAWALLYKDGVWMDFDTTPAGWSAVENQHASSWEPLSDFFSTLRFHFSMWRWTKDNHRNYLMWAILPLAAVLAWRVAWGKYKLGVKPDLAPAVPQRRWPGQDSEFYLLARRMAELGSPQLPGETVSDWIERLTELGVIEKPELLRLLRLHYRYRFDPEGISHGERRQLRAEVTDLLRHS
jgi:protein-glutamine gamma-glutamyltransferase